MARGLRFFIVAYLSFKFGEIFSKLMEKEAAKWFTVIGLIIVTISGIIYLSIK